MKRRKTAGLTFEYANRLREDFKRSAHVQAIIKKRLEEQPIKDEILRISITLLLEECDAIFSDFKGKLDGTSYH